MSYAKQMLETYRALVIDASVLAAAIDALNDCAQACDADADADLGDDDIASMITCLRLCLDCSDVCTATARVTTRQTASDLGVTRLLVEASTAICARCGDECQKHAPMHAHCRVSEQACRRCEQACKDLLAALPEAG
jgi:hypothetical protein